MRIGVFSSGSELAQWCREAAAELSPPAEVVARGHDAAVELDADLYIWDYEPGRPLPAEVAARVTQGILLVSRNDLQSLRAAAPGAFAKALLKPVSRETVLAAIEQVSAVQELVRFRTERDEVLEYVIRASSKLQERDKERSSFLVRTVHDFGASLTAINGYCSLLLGEGENSLSGEQREIAERIQASARRLARLAGALLHLGAGADRETRPSLRYGDPQTAVYAAVRELAPAFEQRNVSVEVDAAPGGEMLRFDPAQIQHVTVSLLENACKFTPACGSIDVKARPCYWDRLGRVQSTNGVKGCPPNAYRVDIRDSGPAIPVERLDGIFEEYSSYFGGSDRSGCSLGLAICRSIIEAHGGRIWAENGPAGPTITFVLPFRQHESKQNPCDARPAVEAGASQ